MAHLPQPWLHTVQRGTLTLHKRLPQDTAWEIEGNFLYPGCSSLGSPKLLTRLVNIAQANQMKGKLHCRTPQRWRNGSAECWAGDALHLRFCRVAEFRWWAKNEIRGLWETMRGTRIRNVETSGVGSELPAAKAAASWRGPTRESVSWRECTPKLRFMRHQALPAPG